MALTEYVIKMWEMYYLEFKAKFWVYSGFTNNSETMIKLVQGEKTVQSLLLEKAFSVITWVPTYSGRLVLASGHLHANFQWPIRDRDWKRVILIGSSRGQSRSETELLFENISSSSHRPMTTFSVTTCLRDTSWTNPESTHKNTCKTRTYWSSFRQNIFSQ